MEKQERRTDTKTISHKLRLNEYWKESKHTFRYTERRNDKDCQTAGARDRKRGRWGTLSQS